MEGRESLFLPEGRGLVFATDCGDEGGVDGGGESVLSVMVVDGDDDGRGLMVGDAIAPLYTRRPSC